MENKSIMVVSIIQVQKGASKKILKEYDLDAKLSKELKVELDKEKIIDGKEIEVDDDKEIVPGFNDFGHNKNLELIESNYEKGISTVV